MSDQRQHWNELHTKDDIEHFAGKPTDFAKEVLAIIRPDSKILELGCGVGNDSVGLAEAGHLVLATDFSQVAIAKNSWRFKHTPHLTFEVLDLNEPLIFSDNEFDVVYARLSLHYFTHQVTERIFDDIHRVLKRGGFFCFVCKSTDDPLYGKGLRIEKDMFENEGHIRHFFSEEYVKSLLSERFEILRIKSGKAKFYGKESAFVKIVAKAIK